MNAIILCGGLSTRLKDIAKNIPKILLDINGYTVLDMQLQKIKKMGIDEVVLAAGHLSGVLRDQVGEKRCGVKIIYAIEPEKLGTGGAIKYAWDLISKPNDPTIIFNGDVLIATDINKMLSSLRLDSDGMIYGSFVSDASPYGTLIFNQNNNLLSFQEKTGGTVSGFINGGIYLFNPQARQYFSGLGKSFSIEYDVFPKMKNLDVYPSRDEWVDIGVPERLEWARKNWQF